MSSKNQNTCNIKSNNLDIAKFFMCTLVSRDCVPFCKFIKCHVYPEDKGTHDKLKEIQSKK